MAVQLNLQVCESDACILVEQAHVMPALPIVRRIKPDAKTTPVLAAFEGYKTDEI